MQKEEIKSDVPESAVEKKSMQMRENGTQKTVTVRHESRIYGGVNAYPILVSEQQFEIVKQEHLTSMNLLNNSAEALLGAMKSCVPPEGSGRSIGEYTGQNMRQLAKSVCDIIQTKTQVVRAMHSIARDEF